MNIRYQSATAIESHLRVLERDVSVIRHVHHKLRVEHCVGELQLKPINVKHRNDHFSSYRNVHRQQNDQQLHFVPDEFYGND